MFLSFSLSLDILATVWATFLNIGRIFVQFSGHSDWQSDHFMTIYFHLLKNKILKICNLFIFRFCNLHYAVIAQLGER